MDTQKKTRGASGGTLGWRNVQVSFPRTPGLAALWAVLVFILVLGAGAFYAMNKLSDAKFEALLGRHYTQDGKVVGGTSGRMIQFWTPSKETRRYLRKDERGGVLETEKWMIVEDDSAQEFGDVLLQMQHVLGYRWYQVFGHGQDIDKEGLWWVVTVSEKFDTAEIVKAYSDYWYKPKGAFYPSVYIEEQLSGHRGRYE